jgi:hypothetical protein
MSWVQDLLVRIRGDKTQLDSTLTGAKSSVSSFGDTVKKLGAIIGIAFGVREIVNFSKEAMKLAAEAEGVKNAFMKIGSAKSVLEDIKRATRGVIEESDLMVLAVKAQNFNIPLKDLGTYLEFATNRAISTGKSVAELSELIVTGLGRKSSRSFIQLGLSAKTVQEAFKTSSGMINLVTDALNKMGPVADTAQVRMGQMAANMKNLKESWGEFLNNSPAVQKTISDISKTLENMAIKAEMKKDKRLPSGVWQIMTPDEYKIFLAQEKAIDDRIAKMKTVDTSHLYVKDMKEADWAQFLPKEKEIETITTLNEKLKEYKTDLEAADTSDKTYIADLLVKINRTEAYIKKLTELSDAIKKVATDQLNILPQNNKPTSVFGKKTYGVSSPLSNKLAGAPSAGNQSIADAMGAAWQDQMDEGAIMSKMDDLQTNFEESLSSMRDMAVQYGGEIAEALGEALGGGNVKDLGKGLLLSMANLLSSFGSMLIALGAGTEAFKTAIHLGNGVSAIIAGAAMLVAAGAIKGLMSNASSSTYGSGGGGGSYSSGSGTQTIKVVGVLRGKDIHLSGQAYSDSLNSHT